MKRLYRKLAVIGLVISALEFSVDAQTRIRFAKGRTSATASDTLGGNATRTYSLGARSGQTLSGNVSSRNGCVEFTEGDTSTSFITLNGNNYISITNNCNRGTGFTLTVSIY